MVFGVLKIEFTLQPEDTSLSKDVASMCRKISQLFSVAARAEIENHQLSFIAVSALSSSEIKLEKIFEKVLDFCEKSHLGRVYDSCTYWEDFERIPELSDAGNDMEYAP